jgi:hypothetical protein
VRKKEIATGRKISFGEVCEKKIEEGKWDEMTKRK